MENVQWQIGLAIVAALFAIAGCRDAESLGRDDAKRVEAKCEYLATVFVHGTDKDGPWRDYGKEEVSKLKKHCIAQHIEFGGRN